MSLFQTPSQRSEPKALPLPLATKGQVQAWIHAANRAPSADNMQPWQITIEMAPTKIVLHLTLNSRTRMNPCEMDGLFSASYVALGALAKNLQILAAVDKHELRTQVITQKPGGPCFSLHFHPQPIHGTSPESREALRNLESYAASIPLRRTDRLPWKAEPLNQAQQDQLGRASRNCAHSTIKYIPVQKCQEAIREIGMVDVFRYIHKSYFMGLLKKFRFGKEAQETGDGLAENTLGIPRLFSATFALIRRFPLLWVMNFFGSQYFSAWYGCTRLLKNSSGLITIKGGEDTPEGWLKLGQDLQSIWLDLTKQGLVVQPVGTLLILYRAHLEENKLVPSTANDLSKRQLAALRKRRSRLEAELSLDVSKPTMVLRVGMALSKKTQARSLRRPFST